jgi:FSR family fosmidomycin resistance protein-like MFS transporter
MNKKRAINRIGLLSLCHMGIDFLCAFSLYRCFRDRYEAFLLYNFCAFALQLPLGIFLDLWTDRKKKNYLSGLAFTIIGIVLTIAGSFCSHMVLGIGNAFFHVGGGVITIREDDRNGLNGKGLGTFVAPGAIGLILGILYHDSPLFAAVRLIASVVLAVLAICLSLDRTEEVAKEQIPFVSVNGLFPLILLCFFVVILRSLTGMAMTFSWKNTDLPTLCGTVALASGKTAGGFLSARFGMKRTIVISLLLSAIAYVFGHTPTGGLLALFTFNMTMPLTLYLLAQKMKKLPGTAFGILTFALFLGYLPVHYGYLRNISPFPFGTIASLASMLLLYAASTIAERKK